MKKECTKHDGSFHVSYATSEDNQIHQAVEVKNITHQFVITDGEYENECGWVLDTKAEANRAFLMISTDGEDFDVQQFISEETCYQLADMFASVADQLREMRLAALRESARVEAVIESSKLPFNKP